MVSHGIKHVFKKATPNLSSSERTSQLRSKTVYAGTVELSNSLATPGSNRYKTYNGPFEIAKKHIYTDPTLVASASYKDLLDITQGKVLLNQLPLTNLTYNYYAKNFANGEMYVGNYQQFNGSVFSGTGPTGCVNSVLTYDLTTTGFTGPGSYTGNSIGVTGPTGTIGSNQNIFIDPKHCYYSDPCTLSDSYLNFVDINFKGPTGPSGPAGITGHSQFYAQQIINSDQYRGFSFPMSNFTLGCKQQIASQSEGPIFCPSPPLPTVLVYSTNQGANIVWGGVIYTNTSFNSYEANVTSIPSVTVPNKDQITQVTIGSSVTSVGDLAFFASPLLTSVTIGSSVTSIGVSVLNSCFALISVTIPNSVISIGEFAFANSFNLPSITLPTSITSISDGLFESCFALTSIIIPSSVTSIGEDAFLDSGLTSITIPNSVTSIGDYAFSSCAALSSVTLGSSVTSIGDEAFSSCPALTSITIPNSVQSIGSNAFLSSGLTNNGPVTISTTTAAKLGIPISTPNSFFGATNVSFNFI